MPKNGKPLRDLGPPDPPKHQPDREMPVHSVVCPCGDFTFIEVFVFGRPDHYHIKWHRTHLVDETYVKSQTVLAEEAPVLVAALQLAHGWTVEESAKAEKK